MLPREYPNLYIDGRWQEPDSNERLEVISPSTGEKIGYVPAANATDIDRAVEAARKAFYETDWPTRPVEERAEMMERLAALIAEHQPEFRDLIVDELGHTKLTAEVYHSVAPTLHWNYYAQKGREHKFAEVREADLSPLAGNAGGLIMKYESKSLLVREPVGVVAAMTAFNFPLLRHRPEDRARARGRLHRGGQDARSRPAARCSRWPTWSRRRASRPA